MAPLSKLDVILPSCWYWVDTATTPVPSDPDEPEDADPQYRAFEWAAIGEAARTAISAAERNGAWDRRRGTVNQPVSLSRAERMILDDWLYVRPPLSSLFNDPVDPFIFDGRHRLWLAGQAGAWPLPVLSVELSDIVRGDLQGDEALAALCALEQAVLEIPGTARLNSRHLAAIRRAIQATERRPSRGYPVE